MIENGPKLLIFSSRRWSSLLDKPYFSSGWLLVGALTAGLWPAMAVVLGQFSSSLLGFSGPHLALQRAAVGLTASVGGALVMAPALTLVVSYLGRLSKVELSNELAGTASMILIWPVWAAGVLLFFPPLAGLGPEIAEILWCVVAVLIVVRSMLGGFARAIGVRRRWARVFEWRLAITFALLFPMIVLVPSFFVRSILGAATVYIPEVAPLVELPMPAAPNW